MLEIDPPKVRVRDIGSRNGTYVNGVKIGQRDCRLAVEEAARMRWPERPLPSNRGDGLRLAKAVPDRGGPLAKARLPR